MNTHDKTSLIQLKKIVFACIRYRHEISWYEGTQANSGQSIKVCHIGDVSRGQDFIVRLFGYFPERKISGKHYVWSNPNVFEGINRNCDILMVEINRMFSRQFRQKGYFTIPQWVEFGREVCLYKEARYNGAGKSLKSDLNRIRKSTLTVKISKSLDEFNIFYRDMYLPYLKKRFGSTMILKKKSKLRKEFSSGFLMLLKDSLKPIAGAIVRVGENTASVIAIGILRGAEKYLKAGVSGEIDFHVHEWAAKHGKAFINVGHTRPFPSDGVYFNKRKWLMRVFPDDDGVMDMAFKINKNCFRVAQTLEEFPFVYSTNSGLEVFCTYAQRQKLKIKTLKKIWKSYWTEGLNKISVFSVYGYTDEVLKSASLLFDRRLRLITDLPQSLIPS